jgi:hypothetical protein
MPIQLLRQAVEVNAWSIYSRFLAFIRTAQYWTTVHPGLEIEDDVRELMTSHKEFAYSSCVI